MSLTTHLLPPLPMLTTQLRLWGQQQGRNWIYVGKLLCAMYLATVVSMLLQLPHTRSAVLTVLLVMQPQTGQVLTKSIYRVLGTIVGLAVTLLLIALFSQQPTLFLLTSALWAGLCVTGAIRFRDMRAYAFLLAGYTIGLTGIPAALNPDMATLSALNRMLAVIVGIVCSGAVSALLFPTTTTRAMEGMLAGRLGDLAQLSGALIRGSLSREEYNRRAQQFAAKSIAARAIRQAAVVENPQLRGHNKRLIRINSTFASLGTQLHALAHFLEFLRADSRHEAILTQFKTWQPDLLQLLDELAASPPSPADLCGWERRFDLLAFGIKQSIRDSRSELAGRPNEALETLAELLYRFVDALLLHLHLYAGLASDDTDSESRVGQARFRAHINTAHTLSTGLRTTLVILAVSAGCLISGWSGSTMAIQTAIITAVLTASVPNPGAMGREMTQGAVLGLAISFLISYLILPRIEGLPLLLLAIAPPIVIGGWMTLSPRWFGIGFGAMVNFCLLTPLDNPASFTPQIFVNASAASIVGFFSAAVLLSILFPPSGHWLYRNLLRDLRRLVERSAQAPLPGLAGRIDSQGRDLLNQAYSFSAGRAEVQQVLLDWSSAVQSVSHALIALRQHSAVLPGELRVQLELTANALAELFRTPSIQCYQPARDQIQTSIQILRARAEPDDAHFSESPIRQHLVYLHLIDSVLSDPQSVFAPYRMPYRSAGDTHDA